MTPDEENDRKPPAAADAEEAAPIGDERLLDALRHEMAKQELLDYEPTAEELREVEPAYKALQARINEKRRANLLATAAAAVELPNLLDKSREWLLARLAELREIARALPGGVSFAHRNLDAQNVDDVPTEELRSYVADLEVAIAAALSSTR